MRAWMVSMRETQDFKTEDARLEKLAPGAPVFGPARVVIACRSEDQRSRGAGLRTGGPGGCGLREGAAQDDAAGLP